MTKKNQQSRTNKLAQSVSSSKVYFTATDPEGRKITCLEKNWKHVKEQHPEINRPNQLKNVIQKPDYILTNTRKALIYTAGTESSLYLNVIVKTEDEYPFEKGGIVSTAHYTRYLLDGSIIWSS